MVVYAQNMIPELSRTIIYIYYKGRFLIIYFGILYCTYINLDLSSVADDDVASAAAAATVDDDVDDI